MIWERLKVVQKANEVKDDIVTVFQWELVSFVSKYNQQQHVFFIDLNNQIGHFYYNGNCWSYESLTGFIEGAAPQAGSPLTGFVSEYNQQLHVSFIDANNHIKQLVYNGNKWGCEDLTAAANCVPAQVGSALTSFASEYNQQQHVIFIDANNHIGQMVYDGIALKYEDLTAGAKGATPQAGSALIGFASEGNQQQYVFFVDANNYIGEIIYNGENLSYQDLKLLTYEGRMMTGYADGYQPHVFFIDPNNIISHIIYGLHCEELIK